MSCAQHPAGATLGGCLSLGPSSGNLGSLDDSGAAVQFAALAPSGWSRGEGAGGDSGVQVSVGPWVTVWRCKHVSQGRSSFLQNVNHYCSDLFLCFVIFHSFSYCSVCLLLSLYIVIMIITIFLPIVLVLIVVRPTACSTCWRATSAASGCVGAHRQRVRSMRIDLWARDGWCLVAPGAGAMLWGSTPMMVKLMRLNRGK